MTLLLLLLLAITGRALAAPCATDAHGDHAAAAAATPQQAHCHHSGDAAHEKPCAQQGDQTGGDCERGCNCCPGHCATALPSSNAPCGMPAGVSPATAYREDNSSPSLESAIRPPISR